MAERFRSFRVEGVVLKQRDWGEADRIITVFTRENGKMRMIAKGARKIQSRKAGHVEPFTHIVVQLDKTKDLPIINQVETVEPFFTIRDSLPAMTLGMFVLELVDRFTREEEGEDEPLFALLCETLRRLETIEDKWLAVSYFQLRLLDCLGYRPSFFQCASCQKPIQAVDQYFSPDAGGVLCPDCGAKQQGTWKLRVEPLRFFRHFQRSTFTDAQKAEVPVDVRKQMDKLMQDHLSYLLERNLNTPKFMYGIND